LIHDGNKNTTPPVNVACFSINLTDRSNEGPLVNFSMRTNACLLAAISTLIAGCGGGNNDSTPVQAAPAVVVTTAADVKSVDWNAPATIDVLANDSASRGALTLSAVTGAEHGTAVISNGKIIYTPAAGFFGTEKLSYTVSADGGATGKADAVVTVEAVMTLNGNASDNPIANGSVTATVGARKFTATTDASGNFVLPLRTSTAGDFVTLVASGAGTQSAVKLASLVGDVATLAKSASSGQVSMAAVPAIGVTHITSAFMALATKSNGGVAPATAQQLKDAAPKVDIADVMRLATAIKLTADNGVALPAGVTDTLAMVNSDASVNAVYTAAASIDPNLAAATRASVEGQVSTPGANFTLDGLAARTIVYRDFTVTYNSDGTGRMSGRLGDRNLTWVADGATVRMKYEKTAVYDYDANSVKVNGVASAYAIRESTEGMIILRVLNENSVKYGETGTVVWTSGPDVGKAVAGSNLTTTNGPITLSTAFNLDQRLVIPAATTAVGSVLAGVFANPLPTFETESNPGTAYLNTGNVPQTADALQFTSATEAKFLLSGAVVNWSVLDNYLVITDRVANAATWKMALLGTNSSTGQTNWVATSGKITVPFSAVVQDAPKPVFTEALAVHKFFEDGTTRLSGQPQADHTVISTGYPSATYDSAWSINTAGELVITHTRKGATAPTRVNRYSLMHKAGNKLVVLFANGSQSALVVLQDLDEK